MASNMGRTLLDGILPLYDRERWNRWRFYEIRHQAAEAELRLVEGKLDRAGELAHPGGGALQHKGPGSLARQGDRVARELEQARARLLDPR